MDCMRTLARNPAGRDQCHSQLHGRLRLWIRGSRDVMELQEPKCHQHLICTVNSSMRIIDSGHGSLLIRPLIWLLSRLADSHRRNTTKTVRDQLKVAIFALASALFLPIYLLPACPPALRPSPFFLFRVNGDMTHVRIPFHSSRNRTP